MRALIAAMAVCIFMVGSGALPAKAIAAPTASEPEFQNPQSEEPQNTRNSILIRGKKLAYTASTGHLTIRNTAGEPTASMFYVAYVADRPGNIERPVTFLFNGGPGSSSMWLLLSGVGPVRMHVDTDQNVPLAPYSLLASDDSLLDRSDLVFLDAIGTGLSRAAGKTEEKSFFSLDSDVNAYADAIIRYLEINHRWNSPKFLMGESYGTTRAAALSYVLQLRGIQLNGVVLVSPVLDYSYRGANADGEFVKFLPTMAATAWYHGRIPDRLNIDDFMNEARAFALGPYAQALAQGDALDPATKREIAGKLAGMTGLSPDYVLRADLRVDFQVFRKELLRSDGKVLGRIDSRFKGPSRDGTASAPDYDAAETAFRGAFVAALNNYLFETLALKTSLTYRTDYYDGIGESWDFSHEQPGGGGKSKGTVIGDLAATMRENPAMKVLAQVGYYDGATPFFGAEYDLNHLGLDAKLRSNVSVRHYRSGHMIYIERDARQQMFGDLKAFYDDTLRRR